MFSEDYEEVKMQERISTAAARGCVERWLIQVCNHDVFIKKKKKIPFEYEYEFHSCTRVYMRNILRLGRGTNVEICTT